MPFVGRGGENVRLIDADALIENMEINKKKRGEHCYGVAEIWTEKPKEAE